MIGEQGCEQTDPVRNILKASGPHANGHMQISRGGESTCYRMAVRSPKIRSHPTPFVHIDQAGPMQTDTRI